MEDARLKLIKLEHDRLVKETRELNEQMRMIKAVMEDMRKRFPEEVEEAEREIGLA